MSGLTQIAPNVYVYKTSFNPTKVVELIEEAAKTFLLEKIANRPHLTMEFPKFFDSRDSSASVALRSLIYASTLPAIESYMLEVDLFSFSIKKEYITVSKLLPEHGGMSVHKDNQSEDSNHFICMLYLNDDYEGGELAFPDLNVKYKALAGDIIMYKANIPHEVLPLVSGVRYTAGYGLTDGIEE